MAVANVEDPSALSHLIAGALRIPTEERQSLLEEVDVAKRLRRLSEILAREVEVVEIGTRIQSQVQSEIDKTQREYFLRQQLKAIQEELGERDPAEAEVEELREQLGRARAARGRAQAGRPRALAAGEAPAGRRRARRDPHLAGVDRLAAVGRPHRRQPRPRARARGARRRPLRHRARSRTASSSSSRCASCKPRRRAARSILCLVGPPGVGKTSLGRSIARAHGAPVRAHQRRRRARRGRDPRPPPDLHRRDAGR